MHLSNGPQQFSSQLEKTVRLPNEIHLTARTQTPLGPLVTQSGYDGRRSYLTMNGQAGDGITQKAGFEQQLYLQWVNRMTGLLRDPSVSLTPVGEATVNGRPADGVRITCPRRPEVTYYFDRGNGLPVKVECRSEGSNGDATVVETYASDYRSVRGLMVPFRLAEFSGGKRTSLIEWTSVEVSE
jgi:hypothetical protein